MMIFGYAPDQVVHWRADKVEQYMILWYGRIIPPGQLGPMTTPKVVGPLVDRGRNPACGRQTTSDLFSMPPILSYYIWSPDGLVLNASNIILLYLVSRWHGSAWAYVRMAAYSLSLSGNCHSNSLVSLNPSVQTLCLVLQKVGVARQVHYLLIWLQSSKCIL